MGAYVQRGDTTFVSDMPLQGGGQTQNPCGLKQVKTHHNINLHKPFAPQEPDDTKIVCYYTTEAYLLFIRYFLDSASRDGVCV